MSTPSCTVDRGPDLVLPSFAHHFATIEGTRLYYVPGGKEEGETGVTIAHRSTICQRNSRRQ
ncbi:hypothetical protein [Paraburkholderia lycopersici]|uniref:Uncharacterized protein n=1 Tax=Paraburkholderia lycopersici TaxID=416944 RepID=A0A1G6HEG4_9BURK|nr:hypothetical protein [Paraburkholderia lycopersici]SDB92498.1 hypothetical protein SAMN05421548_102222 [Paraburkholderia lycopersici]